MHWSTYMLIDLYLYILTDLYLLIYNITYINIHLCIDSSWPCLCRGTPWARHLRGSASAPPPPKWPAHRWAWPSSPGSSPRPGPPQPGRGGRAAWRKKDLKAKACHHKYIHLTIYMYILLYFYMYSMYRFTYMYISVYRSIIYVYLLDTRTSLSYGLDRDETKRPLHIYAIGSVRYRLPDSLIFFGNGHGNEMM